MKKSMGKKQYQFAMSLSKSVYGRSGGVGSKSYGFFGRVLLVAAFVFCCAGINVSAQTWVQFHGGTWSSFKQLVENSSNGDYFEIVTAPNPALPSDNGITLYRNVSIRGTGTNSSITLIMTNASERHFVLNAPNQVLQPVLTLENMTLYGGDNGGGVYLDEYTNLVMEDVIVEHCVANTNNTHWYAGHGGGVGAWSNTNVSIKGGRFTANSAQGAQTWSASESKWLTTDGSGGGIASLGTVSVENTLFNLNYTTNFGGSGNGNSAGAITASTLTLKNCVVTNNISRSCGGVSAVDVTLIGDILITENEAIGGSGGGIVGSTYHLNNLKKLTVTHNKATGRNIGSGPWLAGNTIATNFGGGIGVEHHGSSGGSFILPSTAEMIVTDNLCGEDGGGICARGSSTQVTLAGKVTIARNKAGYNFVTHQCDDDNIDGSCGGGIFSQGPLTLKDTIYIYDNETGGFGGGICATVGQIISQADTISVYNNIAGHSGGGIAAKGGLTLRNKTNITNNKATGVAGGGIYCEASALTLGGTLNVSYNEVGCMGGGICVYYTGASFTIEDYTILTVTYNKLTIHGVTPNGGGGIHTSANLTVPATVQLTVTNNLSGSMGGGIYSFYNNNMLTLRGQGVTISHNKSGYDFNLDTCNYNQSGIGGAGGGICAHHLVIENTKPIVYNEAGSGGGGVYAYGSFTDNGVDVTHNIAYGSGGGIFAGALTLINGINVSHNIANGSGGGIYKSGTGACTFANNITVLENTARNGSGGGMCLTGNCTFTTTALNKLTVNNNSSRNVSGEGIGGGGICLYNTGALTFPVGSELEVLNNLARGDGGGIFTYGETTSLTVNGLANISNNKTGYDFAAGKCENGYYYGRGGGICVYHRSSFFLYGTANIIGNMAGVSGGGVFAYNGANNYDYRGMFTSFAGAKTNVLNNIAGYDGGGICANSNMTLNGQTTISNNKAGYDFTTNECSSNAYYNGLPTGNGGGIYIPHYLGTTLTLSGTSTISNNIAAGNGGGICASASGQNYITQTIIIDSSTISGNISKSQRGGGICLYNTHTSYGGGVFITNSKIIGNKIDNMETSWDGTEYRSGDGGGIYSGTHLDMRNCELIGNTAGRNGGGIGLENGGWMLSHKVLLSDVKVQGNYAGSKGGGLFLPLSNCMDALDSFANMNIGGSRAFTTQEIETGEGIIGDVGNYAVQGGGVYINDPLLLSATGNTIFSGNSASLPIWLRYGDRQSYRCDLGEWSENRTVSGSSVISHAAVYTALRIPENTFSNPPLGDTAFHYAYNNYDVNWGVMVKIVFIPNNGGDTTEQFVFVGDNATPPIITNGSKTFLGWYQNEKMTGKPFDFNNPINEDLILYAKWERENILPYEIWNWEDLAKLNELITNDFLGTAFTGDPSETFGYYDYQAVLMQDIGIPGEITTYGDGSGLAVRSQGVIDNHPGDKRFGWYGYQGFTATDRTTPYSSYMAADPTGATDYATYKLVLNNDTCGWDMNSGKGWIPIGFNKYDNQTGIYYECRFEGTFDGQNNTINGLWINRNDYYQGLFGEVEYAYIKDVKANTITTNGMIAYSDGSILAGYVRRTSIDNCHVSGKVQGGGYTGGIAGEIYNSQVTNCSADINMSGTSDGTGGLLGYIRETDVANCSVAGRVVGLNANYVGGLIGMVYDSKITDCSATDILVSGENNIGGLIGYLCMDHNVPTVTNCHANGSVTGNSWVTGGLVGYAVSAVLTDCSAEINVSGNTNTGGLVGQAEAHNSDYVVLTNCHAQGSVNGDYNIGGLAGSPTGSKITNCWADVEVTGLDNIGGLIGSANSTLLNNSWATGNVTGDYAVGGLIGSAQNYVEMYCSGCSTIDTFSVMNCYATGEVVGNYAVGGLVGYMYNGYNIYSYYELAEDIDFRKTNIYNSWTSSKVSGQECVGGFAGIILYGTGISNWSYGEPQTSGTLTSKPLTISSSWASGEVTGDLHTGGFIGKIEASFIPNGTTFSPSGINVPSLEAETPLDAATASLLITKCYAEGAVTGVENTGGFIGRVDTLHSNDYVPLRGKSRLMLTQCYANGNVSGSTAVGGFAGFLNETKLTDAYCLGSVSGNAPVGGFIGYDTNSHISNCYVVGNVDGRDSVGGFAGYASDNTAISECYALECSVTASAALPQIGRMVGNTALTDLTNNYARDKMELNNLIPVSDIGLNFKNGANITYLDAVKTDNSAYAWDFSDIWAFVTPLGTNIAVAQKTDLPVLKAFDNTIAVFANTVQKPKAANCGDLCDTAPALSLNNANVIQSCNDILGNVTITGNSFSGVAGIAVNAIYSDGAGATSQVTTDNTFVITYQPKFPEDANRIITITVTTNNPSGLPCQPDIATVQIQFNAPPVLTSDNPMADICSGTTLIYEAEADQSAIFSWMREPELGISSSGIGSGNDAFINEILYNSTNDTISVTYKITMTTPGCIVTQDVPVTVKPKVHVAAAIRVKN